MYHFSLNGVMCGCDTIEELMAVATSENISSDSQVAAVVEIEGEEPKTFFAWVGSAGEELEALLEKKAAADSNKKKLLALAHDGAPKPMKIEKPKKTKKIATEKPVKKARVVKKSVEEIAALPYVKGGVTWDVTHKIGRKLKRTDYNQLRSELFARKQLPK